MNINQLRIHYQRGYDIIYRHVNIVFTNDLYQRFFQYGNPLSSQGTLKMLHGNSTKKQVNPQDLVRSVSA